MPDFAEIGVLVGQVKKIHEELGEIKKQGGIMPMNLHMPHDNNQNAPN